MINMTGVNIKYPWRITRRGFLKSLLAYGLGGVIGLGSSAAKAAGSPPLSPNPLSPVYLPMVANRALKNGAQGHVLHLHASAVTDWYFYSDLYYGRTQSSGVPGVSQPLVDAMLDRGLCELLGLPLGAVGEAWRRLTPDYVPGDRVAIKVNLNNSFDCSTTTTAIDAIAQPVNSVVRGLLQRGVREADIVVYDAIRSFSDRVYRELVYKGVQIHDEGCHGYTATFNSSDPNAVVQFFPPSGGLGTVRLCDALIESKYLINMPILKGHPLAGVTLGFKNHFGSTNNPAGMHDYVSTDYSLIDQYDALVDLFANPHIRYKTVLTVGDGIYGSKRYQNTPPQPWDTFGGASPCSLFLSTDPVAIDCVMHDLLKEERGSSQPGVSNSYLELAANAGMGVYERGDPWQTPFGSGYQKIVYQRIEM
jgi:uncharacterized protein (DUF362 family)